MSAVNKMMQAVRRWQEERFDRTHGIQTAETRVLEPSSDVFARWPSRIPVFHRVIRRSRVLPRDFIFIDLGCGKGRALLLASKHGFQEIIGVEFKEELSAIARQNIDIWKQRHKGFDKFSVINCDASDFDYPEGNIFVYMNNPFQGPIFEKVARRLAEAARRDDRAMVIAYNSAFCADLLEETQAFRRVDLRPFRFWAPSTVSFFYNRKALESR